jgi:hypothetical protein
MQRDWKSSGDHGLAIKSGELKSYYAIHEQLSERGKWYVNMDFMAGSVRS